MSYFKPKPVKLERCRLEGEAAELFVAEGDSAASAISGVRNAQFQAVLALQGKPLNPLRAGARQVAAFDGYRALAQTLGLPMVDAMADAMADPMFRPVGGARVHANSGSSRSGTADLFGAFDDAAPCRYGKVLLLFDPDADGIHCSVLALMFFYRWMRGLFDAGRVEMVRAPLYELQPVDRDGVLGPPVHAWTDAQQERLQQELRAAGATRVMLRRHRGLGAIDPAFLAASCVDPKTRCTSVMREADARAAIDVFGWATLA